MLLLVYEFLKTGILAVGGGYATLPYLYHMANTYGWFTVEDISHFLAISEITPGPVGINMATFAGYVTQGVPGGIVASLALITLPLLLLIIVLKAVPDFFENKIIDNMLWGLVPCACGLIAVIWLELSSRNLLAFNNTTQSVLEWLLFIGLLIPTFRYKLKPIYILGIGAVFGALIL